MSSQVLVLAIIAFIAGSNAQLVSQDQCDQMLYSPMADFDATKYVGKWFELFRYGAEAFGAKADCFEIEFTLQPTNLQAPVKIDSSYKILPNKEVVVKQTGTAVPTFPDQTTGDWTVTMAVNQSAPYSYKILSTDYDNYAIAYTCENLNATHKAEYAWILVRSVTTIPTLTSNVTVINEAVRLQIKMTDLSMVEQTDERCNSSAIFVPQVLLVAFLALYSLLK